MILDWSQTLQTAERHLSRGKYTPAIEEYRKLVSWDPSDLTMLNTLGDLYVRAGLTERARLMFYRVAQGYRDQGFTSKAVAILKKILRIDPTDLDSAVNLAECYAAQGLMREASRQYGEVADAYTRTGREGKALDIYLRICEINPSDTSVRLMVGDRLIREGRTQRAHECFAAAGDEFCRQRELKQAFLAYLKAQAAKPDDQRTLAAIAEVCAARGEAEIAIPIFRAAVSRNPGDAALHRLLGSVYLSAGRLTDAARSFQKLFALDRSQYRDLLMVAERFIEAGDLDRAVEQTDGIVDGLIANRKEQEAVALLRKVLDRDPEHPRSLRTLALIFRRVQDDINLALTLKTLANSALRRGNRDEAIEALRALSSLEPDARAHRDSLENLQSKALLRIVAHEFVAADDIRGRTSFSQCVTPRTAPNGSARDFQFFTPSDRRVTARESVRIPVVVISDSGGWREFTETVDVSDTGFRFKLVHPVPPMTILRMEVGPSKRVENFANPALNSLKGIVRHCVSKAGGPNFVGVEIDLAPETPPSVELSAACEMV